MKKQNNLPEKMLIAAKKIFKKILIAASSIIIITILIFVYLDYKQGKERDKKRSLESKVEVIAWYKEPGCDVGFPYFYGVVNKSDKTVTKVNFTVEIRKKGFSSALNSYTNLDEDKILNPGEGYGRCFRAQNKNYNGDVKEKDVEIIVKYKDVTFSN